jgi:hypothetical protein
MLYQEKSGNPGFHLSIGVLIKRVHRHFLPCVHNVFHPL